MVRVKKYVEKVQFLVAMHTAHFLTLQATPYASTKQFNAQGIRHSWRQGGLITETVAPNIATTSY
jgi:hypothetical protein